MGFGDLSALFSSNDLSDPAEPLREDGVPFEIDLLGANTLDVEISSVRRLGQIRRRLIDLKRDGDLCFVA